ncbi:hypothetical protein [Halomarina rubra]|uniref:Uncharacterized protein n=1 Tax=Halomarina rubra TaxID=2071873 RepID=A0ABD6AZG0_9EURY|nr:hypothetical protein [Halomarina rubra]
MSVEPQEEYPFDEERMETLREHLDAILDNKEEVRNVFEQTINTDLRFNELDTSLRYLSGVLYPEVEGEDSMVLAEIIVNAVVYFQPQFADTLLEKFEDGDKLVDFLTELESKYSVILTRRVNRHYKGNDWWSNVKTDSGYRSGQPIFHHEITKDYDERVLISSDPQNTLVLSKHFLQQVNSARDDLGEDILHYVNEETTKQLAEVAQELADAVSEYPESVGIAESEDDGKESDDS